MSCVSKFFCNEIFKKDNSKFSYLNFEPIMPVIVPVNYVCIYF